MGEWRILCAKRPSPPPKVANRDVPPLDKLWKPAPAPASSMGQMPTVLSRLKRCSYSPGYSRYPKGTLLSAKNAPPGDWSEEQSPSGFRLPIEGFGFQNRSRLFSDHALRRKPSNSEMTRNAKNMKNRIWAMPADAPASPPKPKAPATNATTRKTNAQ